MAKGAEVAPAAPVDANMFGKVSEDFILRRRATGNNNFERVNQSTPEISTLIGYRILSGKTY